MDLASKDSYIQRLASKVISQPDQDRKKKQLAYPKGKRYNGPLNNQKKKAKKKSIKEKDTGGKTFQANQRAQKDTANKNGPKAGSINGSSTQASEGGNVESKFSTVDILRKRLHEKIEESRGQGAPKDALSEAVQAKRAKRKLERERKKRKRKEFRMKELAQENVQEQQPETKPKECEPAPTKRNEKAIIFNKVEMVEEGYVDKVQRKKTKKQSVKGNITPLTGKNYKQLLSRVEARNAKLEELREKDEAKAHDYEQKMKWTNLLYKAEGIKIRDDEDMLRTALKKKEQKRAQRKKKWTALSGNLAEKMQRRQDKRRRNIQKRKQVKVDKKKTKARKKGRVLPEDLKKGV